MAKRNRQPARAPQPAAPSRAGLYWALAIAAAAVLVYLNTAGNDFVLDDIKLVRDNVRIRSLAGIPHLFASSYWGAEGAQALYRPLVLATYAMNYAAHGLSASGYVLVNIALHGAIALLLFALVRGMGGSALAAGAAGLLFAVHPVHTEAVAAVSGRPELLAAFFFLLALHCHRRAAAPRGGRAGYRLAAVASFACALLSKESAITLLLVVPVMDALVPARGDGPPATPASRFLGGYLPLLLTALFYLAVRRAVLGGIVIADSAIAPLDNPLVSATGGQALMTAFAAMAQYARLLLWPAHLSPDYSFNQIPIVTSALDPRFIAGAAVAAASLAATAVLWRRSPIAAFGLALMALTFSIVSNLVVTIGTLCAERLIYLPSAGLLIAVGVVVDRLVIPPEGGNHRSPEKRAPPEGGSYRIPNSVASAFRRNSGSPPARRLVSAVLAVIVAAAAARTWTRNRDWHDEASLWTAAVAVAPGSARVQSEYGRILMTRAEQAASGGRGDEAERLYGEARTHFETAVQIYPSYSLPLDGLAMIDSLHGRFDQASALYARALEAWPRNYASLTNWASLLWEQSRSIGARATQLRREGKIAESDVLVRQADAGFQQAVDKIDRAVAMEPSYAQAHLVRAMIRESYLGDRAGAAADFEEVLRLEPNHPQRDLVENELQRLRTK